MRSPKYYLQKVGENIAGGAMVLVFAVSTLVLIVIGKMGFFDEKKPTDKPDE